MKKKGLPPFICLVIHRHILLIILLFLLFPSDGNSKSLKYKDTLTMSQIGATPWTWTLQPYTAPPGSRQQVRHAFILRISSTVSSNIQAKVKLEISFTKEGVNETITPELEVDYTIEGGEKSRDKSIYLLSEGELQSVRILTIPSTAPSGLVLEHVAFVERLFDFNTSYIPVIESPSFDATTGEYKIIWNSIKQAEEYQLEWVHINDYPGKDGNKTNLDYDFSKNSTRISTTDTSYSISHVFDQGYLLCRVRAISYADFEKTRIKAGQWSSNPTGKTGQTPAGLCVIPITEPHTGDNLNWQYITNYAEEGKKKEVVTYYDGSMRSHQSVTRLNTEGNILVGETFYDHQGRAAVQSLPVPNQDEKVLTYYDDFNQNELGKAYSRSDFDKDRTDDSNLSEEEKAKCGLSVLPMSTDNGSSGYYSSQNPDKSGFNQFIPDAGKYPFSQTEYEPDNTGRLRSQGGVGKEFQIGSGHETKYFYGKPSQEELNRLFGAEAGHWSHYRKDAVRDANGQLSLSYLDMTGKVIATALAGNPADGLSPLDSNKEGENKRTTISVLDNQPIGLGASQYTSTYHHLVTTSGIHTFLYVMPNIRLEMQGVLPETMCLDSIFTLTIDIKDECGQRPLLKNGKELPIEETVGAIGNACSPEDNLTFEFETQKNLPLGKYTISRVLTLNKKRLTHTPMEWFTVPLDSIIRIKMSEIDTSNCFVPTTCLEKCLDSDNVDSCRMMCQYVDECELMDSLLVADYIPGTVVPAGREFDGELNGGTQVTGGQYAVYKITQEGEYTFPDNEPLSIFTQSHLDDMHAKFPGFFKDPDGNEFEKYDIKSFVLNFKPEYARKLAEEYHPEKACAQECKNSVNQRSALFDHQMLYTESYEEAYKKGLLFPVNTDPFYSKTGMELVRVQMINYLGTKQSFTNPENEETVELSLSEVAAYMATGDLEQARKFRFNLPDQTNECLCVRDRVWEYLRALYLSRRSILSADIEGGNCNAEVPANKTRHFKRDSDFFTADEYEKLTNPNLTQDEALSMSRAAEGEILASCEKQAEVQAGICLDQLKGCIRINGNSTAADTLWSEQYSQEYRLLKESFKTIMTATCDATNMFGSSNYPQCPENGYCSFEEAMADILGGSDKFTFECNPYLINFPKVSGYEYNSYASNKKIDSCACNKLLESEERYNALADKGRFKSAKQFFETQTRMAVDNYQAKVCLCSNAYNQEENRWTQEGLKKLADSKEYIPVNFTCDVCVDCPTLNAKIAHFKENIYWVRNLYNILGLSSLYEPERKRMLTNYLNNELNLNKSYWDYEEFLKKCNATQDTFYCELTKQAGVLEDLLNDVVTSGTITREQCNQTITRRVKILKETLGIPLITDECCNSYIYKPTLSGGLLKMQFVSGAGCNNDPVSGCEDFTLKFTDEEAGYDYSRIIPHYENMRIAGDVEDRDGRYHFYIDAHVTHQGRDIKTTLLGSTCFPVKICYDGSDSGITLCDREEMKGEDCGKLLIANAIEVAKNLYSEYRDSVLLAVEDLFVTQCMSNADSETFNMEYTDNEHHYTLYYYDQAGNLVRTIPPQGVELLDPSVWKQIDNDRKNGERTIFTRHRMETRYLYNSLNQLVAQYMPDHEKMEPFATVGTGSGLPAGMKVVSSEFLNSNQGVLFGENPKDPTQSLIYTTNDGGKNWQEGNIAGLNNLNDICIVSNSVAYIAGNGGTLLKTEDGGESWTVKGSGTTQDLVAICMKTENDGYFFSADKIYHFNGTNASNVFNMPAGETLTSAWFKNPSTGYAAGYAAASAILYHTTDGGSSWVKINTEIVASKITHVQLLDNNEGYALDDNGMLLRTNNAGMTWLPVHINSAQEINFSKIQFVDNRTGWALTPDKRLLRTSNSGVSWAELSGYNISVKDFCIDDKNDIHTLSATGEIYSYLMIPLGTVTGAEYIFADKGTWYVWSGNTLYRKEGTNWTPYTTPGITGNISKLASAVYQEDTLRIALTDQHEVYLPLSGEALELPSGFTPVEMTVKENRIYLLSASGEITHSTDGGASWSSPANPLPGTTTGSFDVSAATSRALIAGDDGRIYYSNLGGLGIIKQGQIILPEQLNAIHSNGTTTVAAGNNGSVLWNDGTGDRVWHLRKIQTNEKLYAVQATNNSGTLAAGQGGKVFECTALDAQPFTIRESVDDGSTVKTIAAGSNILLAGTASGRLDKVQGITYFSNQTGTAAINAARIYGSKAFAVGDGGVIYSLNPVNTSSIWKKQEGKDVYSYVITASARAGKNLFAVTADGNILASPDNGASWRPTSIAAGVGNLKAIHFFDSNHGIAVGKDVVLATSNAGLDWNITNSSALSPNAVYMTGQKSAYIVESNGKIRFYNNGSLSEQYVKDDNNITVTIGESLNDVCFDPKNSVGYIVADKGRIFKTTDGNAWKELLSPGPDRTNWPAYTDIAYAHSTNLNAVHAYDRERIYVAGDRGLILKSTDGGDSWKRQASGTTANLNDIAFKDNQTAILAGTGSTAMLLRDMHGNFSAYFFYDRLGRLVASQNSKQKNMNPPRYAYTRYDALGRVIETGELESSFDPDDAMVNNNRFPDNWSNKRFQVVRSRYDLPLSGEVEVLFTVKQQQNLRNRVASVLYYENYSPGDWESQGKWSHATHFSYDIHGNVKELIHDNPDLKNAGNQYKKIAYQYDLISGNVNRVSYQPGMPDRFYHKYEYDADNRITKVYTSLNGLIWDNDASYRYYKHGPLARAELGDLKVQGIDYAYTLQGWIKAVNGFSDMGEDGSNNNFAKDAFAYSLHYNANDYTPINSAATFLDKVKSGEFNAAGKDPLNTTEPGQELFNGNISKMATAISGMPLLGKTYRYDELNRLIASNTFEGDDLAAKDKYKTAYKYDANGNIKNLTRYGNNGKMDELTYHYLKDGNGNIMNNRLLHVNDVIEAAVYDGIDIDDQGDYIQNNPSLHNYTYDKIGNLIADKQEEIARIEWNAMGKISEIIRVDKPNQDKPNLRFAYDAMGNRISKTVIYPNVTDNTLPKEVTTYYVLDVQGSTMATYENKRYNDGREELFLSEQMLYGSSRLGMLKSNILLATYNSSTNTTTPNPDIDLAFSSRELGSKQYEMTSHTGNVLAVVSDKRLPNNEPDVKEVYDYFPFGMMMAGRTSYDPANSYLYGFGNHEKDFEINSGWYSFGDYGYDSRLGRRPGLDPIDQVGISNYSTFRNNPIYFIDPDGKFSLPNYTDEELEDKGLTRDDMDRFTTLVTNIGNLVQNNPKALDAISNTTGLSQDQILKDMKFGEGPTININAANGDAYARDGEITIDAQVVKDLASVDFNAINYKTNHKELARQAFATTMLIFHEYGHFGDQQTNAGYNTGQYDSQGVNYVDIDFGASRTSKNKREGVQEWSLSKTGHRGTDVTKIGFGADTSVGEGGRLQLQGTSNASPYLRGNNILDLLKIKK